MVDKFIYSPQQATIMAKALNSIMYLLFICIFFLAFACTQLSEANTYETNELTRIDSDEIIKKIINDEQIYYENCDISGDLDFSHLNRSTTIKSDIKIIDSIIRGNVDLSGYKYENQIDFSNSTFYGSASFKGAQFNGVAYFINTCFMNKSQFQYTQFLGDAYFWRTRFISDSRFENSMFYRVSSFEKCRFERNAFFQNSLFSNDANFKGALFEGAAFFGDVNFKNKAEFSNAIFKKYAEFSNARIEKKAEFKKSIFKNTADFKSSVFQDNVDFSATRFDLRISFQSARFNGDIVFSEDTFYKSINLSKTALNRFNAKWHTLQDRLEYDGSAYLALIKSYKDQEMFEDADSCYYDYRQKSQQRKTLGFSRSLDMLAEITCGYGVRPDFTLRISLIIIVFFSLIFWSFNGLVESFKSQYLSQKKIRSKGIIKMILGPPKPFLKSIAEAVLFSTSKFISIEYSEWRPSSFFWKWVILIERLLGWLLLALFLVTLNHAMIK